MAFVPDSCFIDSPAWTCDHQGDKTNTVGSALQQEHYPILEMAGASVFDVVELHCVASGWTGIFQDHIQVMQMLLNGIFF